MNQLALNNKLVKFLLLTGAMYIAWLTCYEFVLKPWGVLDQIITENITYFICVGLDFLHFQPHYNLAKDISETYIYLGTNPIPIIRVGASCNGLELFILFTIFIIFYPSKTNSKTIFIVVGLLLIHLVNIIRNFILTLMTIGDSKYFDVFHRYIFIFMVYGVIFALWLWWANKQRSYEINQ